MKIRNKVEDHAVGVFGKLVFKLRDEENIGNLEKMLY